MIKNLKPFKLTSSQDGVSFLMLKILNPKLAKVVGEKASIVFQHLCYWMQTQKVSTVYRTNKELVSDLEDMFSEQQIQRSKKKLIDAGMITVSFDKKNVWNRTTHYTLTEKGKDYVLSLSLENKGSETKSPSKTSTEARKGVSKESTYKRTTNATKAPKQAVREHNNYVSNDHPINNSKAMKESFEEGFTNKNAVKCPTDLLSLIKNKNEVIDEQPNHVEPVVDTKVSVETSWEDIVNAEKDMMSDLDINDNCTQYNQTFETTDEYISDSDYGDCEVAMMKSMSEEHCIDNHKQQEGKLSLSDLMKKCFDRGFTEDQEKLYSMKMNQQHFVEDY